MTVEKYCEKYDCHIVEYKYYDDDTIYAILEDNHGNSCGSIKAFKLCIKYSGTRYIKFPSSWRIIMILF